LTRQRELAFSKRLAVENLDNGIDRPSLVFLVAELEFHGL
jgi:hypothetical protein